MVPRGRAPHGRVWCVRGERPRAVSRAPHAGFARAAARSAASAGAPAFLPPLSTPAAARRGAAPPPLPESKSGEPQPRSRARARPHTRALSLSLSRALSLARHRSMLATLGMIVPHFYTLPQYKGLTVLTAHEELVKTGAMQQLLIFIGLFEVRTSHARARPKPDRSTWRALAVERSARATLAADAASATRVRTRPQTSRDSGSHHASLAAPRRTVVGIPAAGDDEGRARAGRLPVRHGLHPERPRAHKRKQFSSSRTGGLRCFLLGHVTQAALTGHDFPFLSKRGAGRRRHTRPREGAPAVGGARAHEGDCRPRAHLAARRAGRRQRLPSRALLAGRFRHRDPRGFARAGASDWAWRRGGRCAMFDVLRFARSTDHAGRTREARGPLVDK